MQNRTNHIILELFNQSLDDGRGVCPPRFLRGIPPVPCRNSCDSAAILAAKSVSVGSAAGFGTGCVTGGGVAPVAGLAGVGYLLCKHISYVLLFLFKTVPQI